MYGNYCYSDSTSKLKDIAAGECRDGDNKCKTNSCKYYNNSLECFEGSNKKNPVPSNVVGVDMLKSNCIYVD